MLFLRKGARPGTEEIELEVGEAGVGEDGALENQNRKGHDVWGRRHSSGIFHMLMPPKVIFRVELSLTSSRLEAMELEKLALVKLLLLYSGN